MTVNTQQHAHRVRVISFLSGKGGVTKTTLARAVAVAYTDAQWLTKGLDIDTGQTSFREWVERRVHYGHKPDIDVLSGTINDAHDIINAAQIHLLLVDGAAYGSQATIDVAQISDLVVMACRFSLDDMKSAVDTMNSLVARGIPAERFCVVFSGVPEQRSDRSWNQAKEYFAQTPYFVVDGFIEQKNSFTDAQNEGLSLLEVPFPSVRQKVDHVIQGIMDRFHSITE